MRGSLCITTPNERGGGFCITKPDECRGSLCITRPDECGGSLCITSPNERGGGFCITKPHECRVSLCITKPNECGGGLCITKPDECGGGMGNTRSDWVQYIRLFTLLGEPAAHTRFKGGRKGGGGDCYYGKKLKTCPCSHQPGTGIVDLIFVFKKKVSFWYR
jgi:hypothetical protein